MKFSTQSLTIVTGLLLAAPIAAQSYSSCNPLTGGGCPPNTALGTKVAIDFASGPSDSFTPQGDPTYDSSGASFTVGKPGDAPQLNSKWYIMFGHVDFVLKAAPGLGIVSSAVLQSDDLDEIDWEWLGGDSSQVQSNYFSKGQITSYNRGAFHANPNNQAEFHTYSIDWTAEQIAWQIDGTTVRTLTPETAQGQYPQTPMMVKIGSWSGGDSANAPGTIAWAGGPTDYGSGPYTMKVRSISVTDYSTGTQYAYSDTTGTWGSIQAANGKVNPGGGKGAAPVVVAPPLATSTSNAAPMPFDGTHRDESTYVKPDIYPWVATTLQTSTTSAVTTYPGLPAGWTVRSDGKVLPPSSAAPNPAEALPTSSLASSPPDSPFGAGAGGLEVITKYNDQGFPTVVTEPAAAATAAKHYDEKGFLISNPALVARPSPAAPLVAAASAAILTKTTDISSSASTNSRSNIARAYLPAALMGIMVAVVAN